MEQNKKTPQIRFKGFSDEWEKRKLEEVYNFKYGEFNNNPDNGGEFPIYGANGIIGGYTEYNAENSSVIGHMGAYAGYVVWAEGKHFVTYNGTIAKPSNELINSKFGFYILSNKQIYKICAGSGQPFVSYNDLNGIDIEFPSNIEEQKKIGKYLDNLDNIITQNQRKYDTLIKIKKSCLEKMFPKDGETVPEIRFKGFTGDWKKRKLGDIVGIYDGIHQTPNYQDSGIMFLSVENIATLQSSKYISEEDFKRDYKVYPQENDILMTRIGDVGTTNVVTDNGLKAYYVSLALLKYRKTNPYFLSNAIQSDFVQEGLANRTLKTAIPMKINKDEIGNVDVMLPISSNEQAKIGTYFRNLDNLITLHQNKIEKLKNIKKSCLEKMFI